jgi:hypothetical protein
MIEAGEGAGQVTSVRPVRGVDDQDGCLAVQASGVGQEVAGVRVLQAGVQGAGWAFKAGWIHGGAGLPGGTVGPDLLVDDHVVPLSVPAARPNFSVY